MLTPRASHQDRVQESRVREHAEGRGRVAREDEVRSVCLVHERSVYTDYELADYIDLFLIHDPLSGKEKRLQTYKALLEAKAAGKIRTVGVSN